MAGHNVQVRLARRPVGLPVTADFTIGQGPVPQPGAGEFRVRITHLSLDPAMRGWMNEGKSYVPPVGLGDVMRAIAAGHVEASNHPEFAVGDAVTGLFGVQQYAISDGKAVVKVDPSQAPLERWIGGLGMPGMTAYFGMKEIAKARAGETVVVSAASGGVGSIVGQIAKIEGARAVGIAGGPEKCAVLTDELGFDAAIDYKAANLAGALADTCPDGIDVYFENVGGEIFDTVLTQMNPFGRIPVCGLISAYVATSPPPGPRNLRSILVNRLTMRGFIIFDFIKRFPEAAAALGAWHTEGKLTMREDVREGGIEAYVDTLALLFSGGNNGKLVLKV